MQSWFVADKDGLAKLIEERGKVFALHELWQNAWDTDTGSVRTTLEKIPGKPFAKLVVEDDDPNGFADLAHAYTLFAESEKKSDPTKRGRFNLGEKLVLAMCTSARVVSTKGSIFFNPDGTRTKSRVRRESGSKFSAVIRMTQVEYDQVCIDALMIAPPIDTYFNDDLLPPREVVVEFETTLPTVKSNEEGVLTRTKRKTVVKVYEPLGDEEPHIFEMGIPVVPTEGKFHIDVMQKVPVNMDRDNVPPAYLRKLRALVLNETHELLNKEDTAEAWINDAISHEDIDKEAIDKVLDDRYTKNRAIFDPSDPEANNAVVAAGGKLIHGGALPKAAWGNVKGFGSAQPSGVLRPTAKPYSSDPNADPADVIPQGKWTDGMHAVVKMTEQLAAELLGKTIEVTIVNTSNGFVACYGRGNGFLDDGPTMDFNLRRLGHRFFNDWATDDGLARILDLVVHEFGHDFASNHLSEEYHDGLTKLAGGLAVLALTKPDMFR